MKWLITIILAALTISAQDVIAMDSAGLIVELKEKYGPVLLDTCVAVTLKMGFIVTTKRDGRSGWYPKENYSLRIIEKLGDRR